MIYMVQCSGERGGVGRIILEAEANRGEKRRKGRRESTEKIRGREEEEEQRRRHMLGGREADSKVRWGISG